MTGAARRGAPEREARGGLRAERRSADQIRRTFKRAKIQAFRLYDLRHTFASLLLAAGAPITYVSSGTRIRTTLRFYAKWIPSKGRRWVDVLDGADLHHELNFGTKIWNQTAPAL